MTLNKYLLFLLCELCNASRSNSQWALQRFQECLYCLGPSIYDVHTLRGMSGSDGCMQTGEGVSAPCGRPHRKYLNLSSLTLSCLLFIKEVGVFWTRILSLDGIKSGNFSSIYISNNYKLGLLIVQFKINYKDYWSQISALGPNFSFVPGRSLYWLFQESDVYFMSTTCGRPLKGEGWGRFCGGRSHVDSGEVKNRIFLWMS